MSRAAGFFCQRTVAKDRGRAQRVFGTDMLDFRGYLWHTREETGREGVRAHFPISGQKSFLWQPCLRAQQDIKNDKASFLQGRGRGSWGIFELNEYIFFIFIQFSLSRSFVSGTSLSPSPITFLMVRPLLA